MSFFITFVKGQLRTSKKQSTAIFVGVLIATLFLTFISGIFETSYKNTLEKEVNRNGNWDFKVSALSNYEVEELKKHASIKNAFFQTVKNKRVEIKGFEKPYLDICYVSSGYFENMPIQRKLIRGRFPETSSEIIISKHMLKGLKIGDVVEAGDVFEVVGVFDDDFEKKQENYLGMSLYKEGDEVDVTGYFQLFNKRMIEDVTKKIDGEIQGNSDLLKLYGVFYGEEFDFEFVRMPFMFALFLIFVALLFIFIIKTAFYLNMNSKMKVLGLLRSTGATHKQISICMYLEAIILTIPAIIMGIIFGYGFEAAFFYFGKLGDISFSWVTVAPSFILAMVTVFSSVWRTLKGFKKLTIIDILNIRHQEIRARKRPVEFKHIGIEMAFSSYFSRRKSHRTFLISFSLVLILMGFLINLSVINQIKSTNESVVKGPVMTFVIKSGQLVDPSLFEKLHNISGMKAEIFTDISAESISSESIQKVDIVSIEDNEFEKWLTQNKLNPETTQAITLLKTIPQTSSFIFRGQTIRVSEIACVKEIPKLDSLENRNALFMPLSQYGVLVKQLSDEEHRRALYTRVNIFMEWNSKVQIDEMYHQVNELLSQSYSQDSYERLKHYEIVEAMEKNEALVKKSLYIVGLFIMLIGMINVFSSISINLHVRQKEFATMQSVGMPLRDIRKILLLEGIFLATSPVILSLPINLGVMGLYMNFVKVSFTDFFINFPLYQWILPLACLFSTVLLTYLKGYKKIKHRSLAGALRNELF